MVCDGMEISINGYKTSETLLGIETHVEESPIYTDTATKPLKPF